MIETGAPAPDFELPDQDGQTVRLSDLRGRPARDVHRGQLIGRCEQQTGIVPFGRLVEQVMTAEPYARARRVFWIVDNGSSHRGRVSAERLQAEWPNLVLVHLPFYASPAEPNRDRLLRHPAQGPDAQRLRQPPGRRRPPRRLRTPLQPDRHTV